MEAEDNFSTDDDVVLISARRASQEPGKVESRSDQPESNVALATTQVEADTVVSGSQHLSTASPKRQHRALLATMPPVLFHASTSELPFIRARSLPPITVTPSFRSTAQLLSQRRSSLSHSVDTRVYTNEIQDVRVAGPSNPLSTRNRERSIVIVDAVQSAHIDEHATMPLEDTTETERNLQQWAQMPPTPPQRHLRTRKPAQLAPYTTEMQRYRRRLVRNDWEDAVVVEREYLRAQREKRREREGLSVEVEGQNEGHDHQESRRRRKERRIEAGIVEDGANAATASASQAHQSERSRIADDILKRFGGAISSSSDDEEPEPMPRYRQASRMGRATSPGSASSSQGARVRSRKRHRNALLSESETSTPEIHEISDSSVTESDANDSDDATTVSREGLTTQTDRLSPSRDKDGYTAEERKTYDHHLKYLKRLMPIKQARVHAADVIAMQREKEAGSRDRIEDYHQADDLSREESLRPGETRTRLAGRGDRAGSRLIDDADEESDDSQIPSPESSLKGSSSSESDSDDDVIEDRRGPTDYWPQTIYKRKRDNIDRLLTSAVIRIAGRKAPRSSHRQTKLMSTGLGKAGTTILTSGRDHQRHKKRRRVDGRDRTSATYSTRQPTLLLYGNPPMANIKHRSRYSLYEDNALFDAFVAEFAKARAMEDALPAIDATQQTSSTPRTYSQRSIDHDHFNGKENSGQSTRPRIVQQSPRAMLVPHQVSIESRVTAGTYMSPINVDTAIFSRNDRTPLIQRQLNMDPVKTVLSKSPQLNKQRTEMDIWRGVCDLRLTFGLQPPQAGTRFSSETYLGKGRLYELIQLARGIVRKYDSWSLHIFGCEASLSSSTVELQEALHAAEEQLRSVLQADEESEEADRTTKRYIDSLSDLLRLLAIRSNACDIEEQSMSDVLYNSLQHLITTVKTWKGSTNAAYSQILLLLRWYKVEISWRQNYLSAAIPDREEGELDWPAIFLEACQELILELLIYGLNRTMHEMKKDDAIEGAVTNGLSSVSAQYWIGLIHLLSQDECKATFGDYCSFWPLLEASLRQYHAVMESKVDSLVIAENGWYCLLALCSLSYYTASAGNAVSRSCLSSGHWSLITQMISMMRLRADEEIEASMSRSSIETRDQYIRILLCRIWHLHSTWGWSLESCESALSKVYSLFDSHKLEDLPTESSHDFAPFLCQYDESLLLQSIQSSDKCFNIFIKILARAASDARRRCGDDLVQADRSIARLFSRFSPMRSMNFSRELPPTSLERSGLYNHYSIALLYLYYVPTSRQQRLLQIQQYLSFTKADEKSRLACIRAMMYAMTVLQHHHLDIKECISWFKGAFKLLVAKLEELYRNGAATGQQLKWQRDVKTYRDLLFVAMRSIQYVIKTPSLTRGEIRKAYPNLQLIDATWTSSLMQSQLVIEGVELAKEVCGILQTYFDFRKIAMMEINKKISTTLGASSRANEESQDSCADLFDDVDFDDALLLDALESAEGPADGKMGKEAEMRNLDRTFAEYLHTSISPAIFRLLSNLFHPERQSKFSLSRVDLFQKSRLTNGVLQMLPSLVQDHDKTTMAELLIDTWSQCAWIMVEDHNIRQWSYYFNYGQEDPRRLQGDAAKRDITLRFLGVISTKYLESNGTTFISPSDLYGANIVEFWTTFLASVVAPRLSSQHVLCNNLRMLEAKRDANYGGLLRNMDWLDKDSWTLEDFEEHKLHLLGTILTNLDAALADGENKFIRSLPFASLTAMLVSIRTYITSTNTAERQEYLELCKHVLQLCHNNLSESLRRGISFELNKTSAAISSYHTVS